jgi:hypothetical protein
MQLLVAVFSQESLEQERTRDKVNMTSKYFIEQIYIKLLWHWF